MYVVRLTEEFALWLSELGKKNKILEQRVTQRIRRMSMGNFGDAKSLGGGVSEARIFSTPALRLYFLVTERVVIVFLWGGDKSNQQKDIERARQFAALIYERGSNEINRF